MPQLSKKTKASLRKGTITKKKRDRVRGRTLDSHIRRKKNNMRAPRTRGAKKRWQTIDRMGLSCRRAGKGNSGESGLNPKPAASNDVRNTARVKRRPMEEEKWKEKSSPGLFREGEFPLKGLKKY